ncbi:DUF3734 domain-containing protein [Paraburkholderia phytofirmans]|uniref:DUF3734 domain-containing protein n=1 Tax=Paraburkholderia phytofirmans TaxID=261302 RepID=UPI0038BCD91A
MLELDAPAFDNDGLHSDIDFSSAGIERRWLAVYEDTARLLKRAPRRNRLDPMEGLSVFRTALAERQK